ncbi:hypothetical protein [Peribacillus glennii]|uniref:hypothetical protein n=1 Tax=Peribacillus glennii TaxID=2303991 RepID=UPI00115EF9AF|nr:hypothetical protein [Peribacillus glennii]
MKSRKRCLLDSLEGPYPRLLMYGDSQEDIDLRTELALYLFQARGVSCSPGQIEICGGTQQAICYFA